MLFSFIVVQSQTKVSKRRHNMWNRSFFPTWLNSTILLTALLSSMAEMREKAYFLRVQNDHYSRQLGSKEAPTIKSHYFQKPSLATCPKGEKTKRNLGSCFEQEKCFSLSYKKIEDEGIVCENSNCAFKWKVCIDFNKDNPCCAVEGSRAFRKACIRGNKDDSCLDDSVSLEGIKQMKKVRFGKEVCEIVRPGENATFQLVSRSKNVTPKTTKSMILVHGFTSCHCLLLCPRSMITARWKAL